MSSGKWRSFCLDLNETTHMAHKTAYIIFHFYMGISILQKENQWWYLSLISLGMHTLVQPAKPYLFNRHQSYNLMELCGAAVHWCCTYGVNRRLRGISDLISKARLSNYRCREISFEYPYMKSRFRKVFANIHKSFPIIGNSIYWCWLSFFDIGKYSINVLLTTHRHVVKSLVTHLKTGQPWWHLRVPNLQMNCRDLTLTHWPLGNLSEILDM